MCYQIINNKIPFIFILFLLLIIILLILYIFLVHNMYMDTGNTVKNSIKKFYNKYLRYKHFVVYHKRIIYFIAIFIIITLIFTIIYIDKLYNFKLAGWISGIGSFSAAIVALLHNTKKEIPVLQYHRSLSTSKYYIEITNCSSKTDFFTIDGIYFTNLNNTDKTDDNNVSLPNMENSKYVDMTYFPQCIDLYLLFKPVKEYGYYVITLYDAKKDKNFRNLLILEIHNYKYISCLFKDSYTQRDKAVPISIEYLLKLLPK